MAKKQAVKKKKRTRSFIFPSHTKGYYRFSKEFPSVTDSDGYRDNDLIVNSPTKKASVRRRLIALFVCVFIIAYLTTLACLTVSKIPVDFKSESATGDTQAPVFSGYNAVYLSGTVLSMNSAESIIGDIRYHGYDTVVIDFKDATGNLYFDPSVNVAADALSMASPDAKKIVTEFHNASIKVFARFCTFADDIYARVNKNEAAYILTPNEDEAEEPARSVWYNKETDSHAWLNPYSSEVQYYLRCCVQDIEAMGVDGIIFDYVSLPLSASEENVLFDNINESTPDEEMASFITLLNNVYIDCTTAATVSTETMLNAINTGSTPSAFLTGCDIIIPDARLSLMPQNVIIGTKKYTNPSHSPKEFITDYITSVMTFAKGEQYSVKIMPLLDASDTYDVQLTALAGVNKDSFILYSTENLYSDNI